MTTTATPGTREIEQSETAEDSAVAAAREAVLEQRDVVAQWVRRRDDARTQLRQGQSDVGDQVLDDPEAGVRIAEQVARLSVEVSMAEQAIVAAGPRVARAEVTYLHAEADRLQLEVAAAEKAHDEHATTTRRLLAELEAHDGVTYLTRYQHDQALESALYDTHLIVGDSVRRMPRGMVLSRVAAAARRQVAAVRAAAAGDNPRSELHAGDEMPACLAGAGALVPSDEHLARVENQRRVIYELEAALERLPREIEDYVRRARVEGLPEDSTPVARRRARLEELPEEIAAARERLVDLLDGDSA